MRRWIFPLGALLLTACTTTYSDPSVRYTPPLFRTQVDFEPPSRPQLRTQVQFEDAYLARRQSFLNDRLRGLKEARETLYREIEDELADCKLQRHCVGEVSKGGISRFERYRRVMVDLEDIDEHTGALTNELKLLERRYDLRVRGLHNRFLAGALPAVRYEHPGLQDVTVHSLEAFPTRRELSYRLARMARPGVVPALYGDLNFKLYGVPVDEAAVLATYDVRLKEDPAAPNAPRRYLVTLLINVPRPDALAYEKKFLRQWGARLGEPQQRSLREDAYCGLYSIAGPALLDQLLLSKAKPCGAVRDRRQGPAPGPEQTVVTDEWLLPVAFTETRLE